MGLNAEFASEYASKIKETMSDELAAKVQWGRSDAANRYSYNLKLVVVMNETGQADKDRESAYQVKEHITNELGKDAFAINGKNCDVVVQASPARRELFAAASKFTSAFWALPVRPQRLGLEHRRRRRQEWPSLGLEGEGDGEVQRHHLWRLLGAVGAPTRSRR